jgi:predicted RNase H-like nuclease
MSYNMMIGYDIYGHFTVEHFPLPQRMTLMTKIYCSRLYSWLQKKTETVRIKLTHFLQFFHSVKPSYER